MHQEPHLQPFGGTPVVQFRSEHDRRSFLRNALLVGVGATYVASVAGDPSSLLRSSNAAVLGTRAAASADLDILNYALTLEYLEAGFYERGIAAGVLSGRELALVTPIRDHELAHVQAVTDTINSLGGKPVEKPQLQFPAKTFKDRDTFLATASIFEELGVKAYHGQVPLIQSHIDDALARGGRALTGGTIDGGYVQPTVLVDVPEDSRAIQEETFGPTITVTKVRDADEAVERANDTTYGLAGAVFSKARGMELARRLTSGMTSINQVIAFAGVPSLPFGGHGDSGFGRIHGADGLREFTRAKAITRQRFDLPVPLLSFDRTEKVDKLLGRTVRFLHGRG